MTNEKHADAMKLLEKGVEKLVKGEDWKQYLELQSRFHSYSYANTMLIFQQLPSASKVAGYKTWQKLGRQVKKGEHGIKIFAPCPIPITTKDPETGEEKPGMKMWFKLVSVFDISQTEGAELAGDICQDLTGNDATATLGKLQFLAEQEGLRVEMVVENWTHGTAKGVFVPGEKRIEIKADLPINQQAKTLAHELAHYFDGIAQGSDRQLGEIVAESAAFVVMQACGHDTGDYSFGYVAAWSGGKPELVKVVGERTQKVAAAILNGINPAKKERAA
jgi:antirestriction protein ArdC